MPNQYCCPAATNRPLELYGISLTEGLARVEVQPALTRSPSYGPQVQMLERMQAKEEPTWPVPELERQAGMTAMGLRGRSVLL